MVIPADRRTEKKTIIWVVKHSLRSAGELLSSSKKGIKIKLYRRRFGSFLSDPVSHFSYHFRIEVNFSISDQSSPRVWKFSNLKSWFLDPPRN